MKLELLSITAENNPIYENLAQLYEAEFAPLTGELPNENGRYRLQTPVIGEENPKNAWGYLVFESKIPIGFAILNIVDEVYDVAEFFVLPSHRKNKVGTKIAHWIFQIYPGSWQVRQIDGANHAIAFWRSAISALPGVALEERNIDDPEWGQITKQSFSIVSEENR